MKTASYGRIVVGISAVFFGVILWMWRDINAWEQLPIPTMPFGMFVSGTIAIAQIVAGLGMFFPRTVRVASVLLGIVYVAFCLACVPGIVAAPTQFGSYVGFFEFFTVVCVAIAVYQPPAARFALGICTVSMAVAQIVYFQYTNSLVPTWIPPNQGFWTILTTVAFGLAAIAILTNIRAKLAMRLMALMIAVFGLLVWVPAVVTHSGTHFNWSEFALNFLICGSVWIVAESA